MEIRGVIPADAEAIRTIYNNEVLTSTVTFDLEPRTMADQLAWIARHQGAHPAVVAVDNSGVAAGFGSLSAYRDRPAYSTTVEDSVYVHAARRRQGIGRLLLDDLVRLAGSHGFHSVVARVADDNAASIDLHLAAGFVLVGTEREIGRKFGRWIDVTVLQLLV